MAQPKTALETRVDILEQQVEGGKMVTRYILEQTRRNGDDLAIVKTRLSHVEDPRCRLAPLGFSRPARVAATDDRRHHA